MKLQEEIKILKDIVFRALTQLGGKDHHRTLLWPIKSDDDLLPVNEILQNQEIYDFEVFKISA